MCPYILNRSIGLECRKGIYLQMDLNMPSTQFSLIDYYRDHLQSSSQLLRYWSKSHLWN